MKGGEEMADGKTREIFSKARKEILLAFRSIIDARIEALEKREKKKGVKKKKIKID